MTKSIILLVINLIIAESGFAQQVPDKKTTPTKVAADSVQSTDAISQQRNLALLRIRGLVERILKFNEVGIKTTTLAQIGDVLWPLDEGYARQLFKKALDLLPSKPESTADESKKLSYTRRRVLALIARRDASWAKRLAAETAANETNQQNSQLMQTNFSIAYNLIKDNPQQASEFAERSLRGGLHPAMYSLLLQLRLKDEPAANALFLKLLEKLNGESFVNARDLLLLGTYIFTSPKLAASGPPTIALIGVGDLLVPDITADRQGISPALIRSYLIVATNILMRPIPGLQQRKFHYVTARLLLLKAEKFAPELISQIGAAMAAISSGIPQALTQESAYENLAVASKKDLSVLLAEIERLPSERRRNERYLSLAFDHWYKGDFTSARNLTSKITETEATARIITLIDFGEALRLLDQGRTAFHEVETKASKLPLGIERAILWLELGYACTREKDSTCATNAINTSLKSIPYVDDARRPFLVLAAAGELGGFDPILASQTMSEAVREFNKQDARSLAKVTWMQRVEIGYVWRDFPLKTKNIQYTFSQVLPSLVATDLDGTITAVDKLADEQLQADAVLAIIGIILK